MTLTLFALFAPLLFLVLVLVAVILVMQAAPVANAIAPVLAAVVLSYGYYAGTELLGRPKPVRLATFERSAETATVLGYSYEEGQAIYLWLLLPGQKVPRAYALPWSQAAAEDLLRAEEAAAANGTEVTVRAPFRPGDQGAEGFFDAPAPPPQPMKSAS